MSFSISFNASGVAINLIPALSTVSVAQFREDLPAFQDSSKWDDESIQMYLDLAQAVLDPMRWLDYLNLGIELFTAHNLVLDQESNVVAARGGIPGASNVGIISSKSVGPGSVSYDTTSGAETDAGMWNLTVYGRRFIRFARYAGAGPVVIC